MLYLRGETDQDDLVGCGKQILMFVPVLKAAMAAIKADVKYALRSAPVLAHKEFAWQHSLLCGVLIFAKDKYHDIAVGLDRS